MLRNPFTLLAPFLLPMLLPNLMMAQVFEWGIPLSGPASEESTSLELTPDGSILIGGIFTDSTDFDPGPAAAYVPGPFPENIYVAKYDPSGNYLWAKRIGGPSQEWIADLQADAQGNFYITGEFLGTADFDPGPGVANLTSSFFDGYLAKYDANGNYLWAFRISRAASYRITVTDTSGVIIAGKLNAANTDFDPGPGTFLMSPTQNSDLYFAKYSPTGNFIWAKHVGGSFASTPTSCTLDDVGNLYMTGTFFDTVDFDPGPGVATMISNGSLDMFVAKFSPTGDLIWTFPLGSTMVDNGLVIAAGSGNDIYVSGTIGAPTDFDPGPGTQPLNVGIGSTTFVAKYDSAGNYRWAFAHAGSVKTLWPATSSQFYLYGGYSSIVDMDPGPGTDSLGPSYVDMYISKFDTAGNYIDAIGFGSDTLDYPGEMCIEANGNIFVHGTYSMNMDANPGAGVFNLAHHPPSGLYDIFLSKFRDCDIFSAGVSLSLPEDSLCTADNPFTLSGGSPAGGMYSGINVSGNQFDPSLGNPGWSVVHYSYSDSNGCVSQVSDSVFIDICTGAPAPQPVSSLSLFPNPATAEVQLSITGALPDFVFICDLSGRRLMEVEVNSAETNISVRGLAAGTYLLIAETDGRLEAVRMVKMEQE